MTPRMKVGAAGVALILATNTIAIAGALYNRSGEPESRLVLGERELSVPYGEGDEEDSGLSLRFRWRMDRHADGQDEEGFFGRQAGWLGTEKLAALGFDTSLPPDDLEASWRYDRQLDRDAFLVLEQHGPAHARALKAAQRDLAKAEVLAARSSDTKWAKEHLEGARKDVHDEQHRRSRLFIVDAGPDLQPLRRKYPDKTRYALVRGHVDIEVCGREHRRFLCGEIADLEVPTVNVPLALRPVFEGARADRSTQVRYTAEFAFGRRLEPWLVSAQQLK
jgi:hypothetical protein